MCLCDDPEDLTSIELLRIPWLILWNDNKDWILWTRTTEKRLILTLSTYFLLNWCFLCKRGNLFHTNLVDILHSDTLEMLVAENDCFSYLD